MTVGELKKYLEAFADHQDVIVNPVQSFGINVKPIESEVVTPEVKPE